VSNPAFQGNDINDIRSALSFIPADDRDLWVRLGMAVKSELGDSGFGIWNEWSSTASNYVERDAISVWRSIKQGSVNIATLFYTAKQYGWKTQASPLSVKPLKQAPKPQNSDTRRYALELWLRAGQDVKTHPYAIAKGINWPAGAARGIVSGQVIGRNADCVIVPIRNLETDKVVAVQCINSEGNKQTFGAVSRHAFITGNPLDKSIRWFVCEGWADAVSLVFHHYKGNAVALAACDKGMMERLAERVVEVYAPDQLIVLEDAA